MHPIFISHLVADFLLQPTWLVAWKKRSLAGLAIHAAIHSLVAGIFLIPNKLTMVAMILAIGTLHGLVDYSKIYYQKHRGETPMSFFLDQLTHCTILIFLLLSVPLSIPAFWQREEGLGILTLLSFFSFVLALWNIPKKRLEFFSVLAASFLIFLLPAALL